MYQTKQRNYQEKKKWTRKSDDDTANADAEVNIAEMTCGSKKLAKKKTLVEMIYRERFNDAEIENINKKSRRGEIK